MHPIKGLRYASISLCGDSIVIVGQGGAFSPMYIVVGSK